MSKPDGGPAFPHKETRVEGPLTVATRQHNGLSLRDYFAGQAMVAIIAKGAPVCNMHHGQSALDAAIAAGVIGAYAYADAMLAEREK